MKMLFLVFLVLYPADSYVTLYNTLHRSNRQAHTCFYYTDINLGIQSVEYCIQSTRLILRGESTDESQCYYNGTRYTFGDLFKQNYNETDLLQWHIPIDIVEQYVASLIHYSDNISALENDFLCNCSHPSIFGRYCEYRLYHGETISEAFEQQFRPREEYMISTQMHDRRSCYITLDTCDYGLLCLDWRQICDGEQNCMNGEDEDYCDKLEFNECEDNEYRCTNGMCIPTEYFLDGEQDCMDWSDEIETPPIISSRRCAWLPSFYCNERLCRRNHWGCGNGECLQQAMVRYRGTWNTNVPMTCENLRDINFICELDAARSFWTIKNGFCLFYPNLSYSNWQDQPSNDLEFCTFLLQCILSKNLNSNCPCSNRQHNCIRLLEEKCATFEYIPYPAGPLLNPYTWTLYKVNKSIRDDTVPDTVHFNGSIKCRGYQVESYNHLFFNYTDDFFITGLTSLQNKFCNYKVNWLSNQSYIKRDYSPTARMIHPYCWNDTKTFDNRLYRTVLDICQQTECISPYRLKDGDRDCMYSVDEDVHVKTSCQSNRQYRFQCLEHDTCLIVDTIHYYFGNCSNRFQNGLPKLLFSCSKPHDQNCRILKNYIAMSSDIKNQTTLTNRSTSNVTVVTSTIIPFHEYCDTFFNQYSLLDESHHLCQNWICNKEDYQCSTGQCIPIRWLCDGEWDCGDASDEQNFPRSYTNLNKHNSQLLNNIRWSILKQQCAKIYGHNTQPFSNACDLEFEYPCLLFNVDDPWNLTRHRPCVNLSRIGDGIVDCYGKQDERNTLGCHSNRIMMGYNFFCESSDQCIDYDMQCNGKYRCDNGEDDVLCHYKRRPSNVSCSGINDYLCLNNSCIRNARCNNIRECSFGEDEYWCAPDLPPIEQSIYRMNKMNQRKNKVYSITFYPIKKDSRDISVKTKTFDLVQKELPKVHFTYENLIDSLFKSDPENYYLPFVCGNDGLAVKSHAEQTVCFCPPNSYGNYCEYSSDRITILTHIDFSNYKSDNRTIVKVLLTFLFNNRVIDTKEFHAQPEYIKQKIYFVYPRTKQFLEQKQKYRNGTQMYHVIIETFILNLSNLILSDVWDYPIYFDYLPAYRLAKILKLNSSINNNNCSICGDHGVCYTIVNTKSIYCNCESGWYGKYCQHFDGEQCIRTCSSNSICRPNQGGILNNAEQEPYCLCLPGYFGTNCYLKYDPCINNRCENGGTCMPNYIFDDIYQIKCLCQEHFHGDKCQFSKNSVQIQLQTTNTISNLVQATVVQYYDLTDYPIDMNIRQQQLHVGKLVPIIRFSHGEFYAPAICLIKIYTERQHQRPDYYLVYSRQNQTIINITSTLTDENQCQHSMALIQKIKANLNSDTVVFYYHQLCHHRLQNHTLICFYDKNYFCLCNNHNRADCFRFNSSLDACSHCLSNGRCVLGDLKNSTDFICLCPHCHYGQLCQYSMELMSFTLDSLIIEDLIDERTKSNSIGFYLSAMLILFLFGFINNFFSLITFKRPIPRKFVVGNTLLINTVISQCSLLILFIKVGYIIISSNGLLENNLFNIIFCKIISYLLSVVTRINYWLNSCITLQRLGLVLYPTSIKMKKPKVAFVLSIIIGVVLFNVHIHELLFYTVINDPKYAHVTLCVINYRYQAWSLYNRVSVLIHYLVPCLIQFLSIIVLIVVTTRHRVRANKNKTYREIFMKQFKSSKELFLTPLIILLSALPQAIIAFTLACSELDQSWQRYILLSTYFLSYSPQLLGFILYVLPSSVYKHEFYQTKLAKYFSEQV